MTAAEAFVDNGARVSHLVLVEALMVLDAVYERSAAQIARAIALLLNQNRLTRQDAHVVAEARESFQARPSLGFSDCMALEIARKAGHLPLGTFDKGLAKLKDACRL